MKHVVILTIIFLSVLSGCKDNPRKEYEKVVKEWIGKTIIFPDSMLTVTGEIITPPLADYTIIAYYNSSSCIECQLKLSSWQKLMSKLDSITNGIDIKLIILTESKDLKELKYLVKKYNFQYHIVTDKEKLLNNINSFPTKQTLQTFLIDSSHKVRIIGNPINILPVGKLYLDYLANGNDSESIQQTEEFYEYNFGKIEAGKVVSHIFTYKNITSDTLKVDRIIVSCECTEGLLSSETILPGQNLYLTAVFKDTIPGDFLRTLTVSFKNKKHDINFEITGTIYDK